MAQAQRKRSPGRPLSSQLLKNIREASVICLAAVSLYLLIALSSFYPGDPAWSHSVSVEVIQNNAGRVGHGLQISCYICLVILHIPFHLFWPTVAGEFLNPFKMKRPSIMDITPFAQWVSFWRLWVHVGWHGYTFMLAEACHWK